ncbi:MAG TPA: hypothetical protein VH987_04435 [Candidatus Limnocylindria bacterium]
MAPRQLAVLLLTLALAGCATPDGSPSPGTQSGSAAPSGVAPGRPYDAATVLQAMRESRRPGGVPEALQIQQVAAAAAAELWTFDGSPWATMAIGGACGPATCSLEVAGTPAGGAGTDLYSFSVDPDAGTVAVESVDLHGYPAALDAALDAAVQAVAADRVRGLAYSGARWLPPPEAGRFLVAYRSGGEEGAPGVDLLVDLDSGAVEAVSTPD